MMKVQIEKEVDRRQNQTLEKVISKRKVLLPKTLVHQKPVQMKTRKRKLMKLSS